MWVVIDTNRLASDELRGFLELSATHRAVIPDYVLMERFKPSNIQTLVAGFEVLRAFPRQVIALKGTGAVTQLNPDVDLLPGTMVDPDETEAFIEFGGYLDRAVAGDEDILAQLHQRANGARRQMEVVLRGASTFSLEMKEFLAPFSPAELSAIRRGQPMTQSIRAKFYRLATSIAESVFAAPPLPLVMPRPENRAQHFVFRNALCTAVYMLLLTRRGVADRKPERARNDVVDVLIATYGTYFNGVMSDDALTNAVHHIARMVLAETGSIIGEDYVPDTMMRVADALCGPGTI